MEFLRRALSGLIIGVANIIPGVSGGTMAVVLGIYDRLIGAIGDLRKHFMESVRFLLPVGLGAAAGILLFSKLIKLLLALYPTPTNFFFLGLVLGGIPVIYRRATDTPLRPQSFVSFAVSLAFMLLVFFLSLSGEESARLITSLTPATFFQLLLSGAVAAACMILPGVSGSMVMMILGVYTSILTAISDFNFPLLLTMGVGVLIGVFGGAKLIGACLRRFSQGTYFAILGLIAGSILPIVANAQFTLNLQGAAALVTLAAGIAVSLLMVKLQRRLSPSETE